MVVAAWVLNSNSVSKWKARERLGPFCVLASPRHPSAQSPPNALLVPGRVHRLHCCRCGAARRRGFLKKSLQRNFAFTPGENSVREGVGCGGHCDFAVESQSLSRGRQRGQGVVAVATGKGDGENVELALGNFENGPELLEQLSNVTPGAARERSVKGQRRESAPAAAHRTGHSSCPTCRPWHSRSQFRKRDASGQTDQHQRATRLIYFELPNLSQQSAN